MTPTAEMLTTAGRKAAEKPQMFTASSQMVDVNKIKEAVEKNRPKHSQLQEGSSNTQAAVAAQQAAIATQANAAVANAQQQAQYIDQTYTAEG